MAWGTTRRTRSGAYFYPVRFLEVYSSKAKYLSAKLSALQPHEIRLISKIRTEWVVWERSQIMTCGVEDCVGRFVHGDLAILFGDTAGCSLLERPRDAVGLGCWAPRACPHGGRSERYQRAPCPMGNKARTAEPHSRYHGIFSFMVFTIDYTMS